MSNCDLRNRKFLKCALIYSNSRWRYEAVDALKYLVSNLWLGWVAISWHFPEFIKIFQAISDRYLQAKIVKTAYLHTKDSTCSMPTIDPKVKASLKCEMMGHLLHSRKTMFQKITICWTKNAFVAKNSHFLTTVEGFSNVSDQIMATTIAGWPLWGVPLYLLLTPALNLWLKTYNSFEYVLHMWGNMVRQNEVQIVWSCLNFDFFKKNQ